MYDVESYEHAWLNVTEEDVKDIENPLTGLTDDQKNNFHLYILQLMRNPKYFQWTVKKLLNVELLPEQVVILRELWTKAFPMYIASRGFGKSFLLAVYGMLRCALMPGTKIVIVGAAFRQSKVIFEYMDTIWKNASLLRSICSDNSGPRRDVDRCTMRINESWAMAVPLGDGSKIRGLRAHTIIADEFNSIPVDIYETVVAGFTAVSKGAKLTTKQVNDLPDSDFAYIAPGGKKVDGKTEPRSLRHLPIPDAAHVRNALARLSQTHIPAAAKQSALRKIKSRAKKFGIDVS